MAVAAMLCALAMPATAQTFERTANDLPATCRGGGTIHLLSDGRAIMIGGDGLSSAVVIYNPATRRFTTAGTLPESRSDHGSVVLPDGRVFVVGADTNGSDVGRAGVMFNAATGTSAYTSTPEGVQTRAAENRCTFEAVLLLDGRVLLTGGLGTTAHNAAASPSAELFDPVTGLYSPTTGAMDVNHWGHSTVRLQDGRVFVIGGQSKSQGDARTPITEIFTPATSTFVTTAPLNVARRGEATLLLDGKVLVTGGTTGAWDGNTTLRSAELFDPVAGTWSFVGEMTEARYAHSSSLLADGRVLIAGGRRWNGGSDYAYLKTAEVYDPTSRTFTALTTEMAMARSDHLAVTLQDGTVLLTGGGSATAEIFSPQARFSVAGSVPSAWGWVRRDGPLPDGRYANSMVYDVRRGRVVLYGGANASGERPDLWEWNGVSWEQRLPTASPPGRHGHAMAYDAYRGRTVVFGGSIPTTVNDTWEWDGTTWLQCLPASSPAARYGAGIAYDERRRRVVLFGGSDGVNPLGDTWEWDGVTWSNAAPSHRPSNRAHHTMAYDPVRQRVVLFGGWNNSSRNAETWEYDGTDWTQRTPVSAPPGRSVHMMDFDRERGRLVLFGGDLGSVVNDTWEWDGTNWAARSTVTSPAARAAGCLIGDPVRGRLVLFGGSVGGVGANDTWEYDGTTWMQKTPNGQPTNPPGRARQRYLAYDSARGRTMMFGGTNNGSASGGLSDTWQFDGVAWSQVIPSTAPPARICHAVAYDSSRDRLVTFGGVGVNDISLFNTWELGNATWLENAAAAPPRRYNHDLDFDSSRGRTVVFGGYSVDAGAVVSDTWEWDGATWLQKISPTSPRARMYHALSYDSARGRMVLFGGSTSGSNSFSDTWEWDGTTWAQRSPLTSPEARHSHSMVYDAVRSCTRLFAGTIDGTNVLADTWDWDGVNWYRRTPENPPQARAYHSMVYDTARRCSVLFGGYFADAYNHSDTWELPSNRPPSITATFTPAAAIPGDTVTLAASFSDPDGDTPTWRWMQTYGPPVSLANSGSAVASFTAAAAAIYGFEVVASDGHGAHAYSLGSVTVNRAPTVSAGADLTVNLGTPVLLTATATDPDGDALTYEWNQTGGVSLAMSPSNTSRVIGVTPNSAGVFTFQVAASDPWGGRAVDSITLTATAQAQPDLLAVSVSASPAVTESNKPLTLAGLVRNSGQAAAPQFDVRFFLSRDRLLDAGDPSLDSATVAGLAASGELTVTHRSVLPSSLATGAWYAGFLVDPANAVAEAVESNNTVFSQTTVRVDPPTVLMPNLVAVAVSGPSSLKTGEAFEAAARVANRGNLDVNSSFGLTFLFSADTALGTADAVAGGLTLTSLAAGGQLDRFVPLTVPGGLTPGAYHVLLQADRAGAIVESSEADNVAASVFPVQVSRPSVVDTTPPVVTALAFAPGQSVAVAGPFVLTATFSEPVNRPVLRATSGTGRSLPLATDPGDSLPPRAVWVFAAAVSTADNGIYQLTWSTTDAASNPLARQPDNNWFRIDITANRPPVADAGPDRTVRVGSPAQLTGAASDLDGGPLTYRWTGPSGVVLTAPNTLTPSFTPSTAGRFAFTLTVTDAQNAASSDSVEFTATDPNTSLRAEFFQVRGVVQLESGEAPQTGSRVQVTNTRTGVPQSGWLGAGSGAFQVEFRDLLGGDAAASGDTLRFALFDPDGTSRELIRPSPAEVLLSDDDIQVAQGLSGVQLTGKGSASTGGLLLTIAGNGLAAFSGDSGPATSAAINIPLALAFDSLRNLYVADAGNARVRRVTPQGIISTVAGNGKLEFSGDGLQATAAGIGLPSGLAVSTDGMLYLADRSNHRVRRVVLSTGVITTIAGTGVPGFSGDGLQATTARLNQPRGLLLRGTSRLLIADSANHRVREVNLSTGVIVTVAGNGTTGAASDGGPATAAAVVSPAGLGLDSLGRLLIAEAGAHRIRRVDLAGGTISTLAGNGRAGSSPDGTALTAVSLGAPVCVLGRSNGDVAIAERDNHRIRLLELGTGRIRTLAGNGLRGFSADGTPAELAALGSPQGLELAAAPDGAIVLADSGNHRVRKIVPRPVVSADDHPDTAAATGAPDTVSVDAALPSTGNLEQAGDLDFFRFTASPGRTYTLRTALGTLADTVLTLFDRDGSGTLAENDDSPGSRASLIEGFRPRVAGTYFARVKGFQQQAIGTYGLAIVSQALSTDPLVATTGLPEATVGQPYGFLLEVAGGTEPYRWTLVGGALPPGLTLGRDSGLISGTPPAPGEFRLAVAAKDANGRDATATFTLAVRQQGQAGFPESAHPYSNNENEAASFRLPGSPAAIRVVFDERTFVEAGFDFLHVTDGGGTPVAGSPFTGRDLASRTLWLRGDTVRVRLVSDGSNTGFGWRIVDVEAAEAVSETLAILPERLKGARSGESYEERLTAPGGTAPLRWSPGLSGTLPPGLSLDTASGALFGVTTAPGSFPFAVKVVDSTGKVGARRYTLDVYSVGGTALPESAHPYASGGEDTQSYTLAGNPAAILVTFDPLTALEDGFDFLHITDGDGVAVAGSPFTGRELAGRVLRISGPTVRVRLVPDGTLGLWGYRVTQVVAAPPTIEPLAWVTPATLPAGRTGVSASIPLTATGGLAPYSFRLVSGRLPPGLALDGRAGVLRGAPGVSGTFAFRLQAIDSALPTPASVVRDFTLSIASLATPGLTVATTATADVLRFEVRLDPRASSLSRVRLAIRYDVDTLDNPRLRAGTAAGLTPLTLSGTPGTGLLLVEASGPPNLTVAGLLFTLDFDLLAAPAEGTGWVTVLSSELTAVEGEVALARPTADAGLDQNVSVRFLPAGGIAATVPDPLDGLQPFVRLDGRESSDPNRPPLALTYRWSQTAGFPVTLSAPAAATPTFVPSRPGEYLFALTVENGSLSSPPDTVRVVVNAAGNSPPRAAFSVTGASASGLFLAARDTVTLDGTLSTDPDPLDAGALRYAWRQTKGRKVTLLDPEGNPSETAAIVHYLPTAPGVNGFELVVTDPAGASSPPASADLMVRPEDWHEPRLSLQSTASTTSEQGEDLGDGKDVKERKSLRVSLPARVTLKALLDDPDVGRAPLKHRATFAWHQVEGPAVRLDGAVLANTDQTVSTVNFEPTTSRVHVFECVVSKLDETGSPTGLEVKRQLRVIVDSTDNAVPEAAFDMRREPSGPGKASFTVGRVSKACSGVGQLTYVKPGWRIQLDGSCSADRGPNQQPLLYRWVQLDGPPVVLSRPFAAVTTFVVPTLRADTRPRPLRFALFVDDGKDRSEQVEGEVSLEPGGRQQVDVALQSGLNLMSVPMDPSVTGQPFTAADLLELVYGAQDRDRGYVVRSVRSGAGGAPARFELYSPGLTGSPFLLEGNQGYLVGGPVAPLSNYVIGNPWPAESLRRWLSRGMNLLALPAGVPPGYDAEQLQRLTGANFIGRIGLNGQFQAYVPGAGVNFPLTDGEACLLSMPASRAVTLPAGP